MKLIWFTDLHLVPRDAAKPAGLDPIASFRACLDHALEHHPDADRIIITGDLIQLGHPGAYSALKEILADCPIPVRFLMGNHDDREEFLRQFPDSFEAEGFVQGVEHLEDFRLIYLDTLSNQGSHAGELCDARHAWLGRALANDNDRPALVFMHHPPHAVGLPGLDRLKLENSSAFAETLAGGNVGMILCGHLHRGTSSQWSGIHTVSLKSTHVAFALDTSRPQLSRSFEAPAYGVVVTEGAGLIVHTQDVMP